MNKYADAFARALENKKAKNTVIASLMGVHPSYVAQMKSGHRPMPADKAVSVAAILDVDPRAISEAYANLAEAGHAPPIEGSEVPSFAGHLHLSVLPGFEPLGEGLKRIFLPAFLVRPRIAQAPPDCVRWAVNPSDAMAPKYERGALLLIDSRACSVDVVVDGSIYAYRLRGRPAVRRILIRKSHWILTGPIQQADDEQLSERDLGQLEIGGLVLDAL